MNADTYNYEAVFLDFKEWWKMRKIRLFCGMLFFLMTLAVFALVPVCATTTSLSDISQASEEEKPFSQIKYIGSSKAAYKAALKALKNYDYTTKFYSDKSYYSIFRLMLKQHPEYNYDTVVWKDKKGYYGYYISSELTDSELDAKWRAADKKANAIVKKKLKKSMTTEQKLRKIHDYLMKTCSYNYKLTEIDGYEDELTAYGVLVKKKGVCQGYTAAFSLLAQKAGIYSIAVCGSVSSGSHTWNYVKIGKKYLHIDCTWDKTLQKGKEIRHDYFAIPGDLIIQNHVWDSGKYTARHVKYCKYII